MFDDKIYSPETRKVIQSAKEEARRLNHECVGTEHILLGLIKQRKSRAYKILFRLKVDFSKFNSEVKRLVKPGLEPVIQEKFPLTPRLKKVIEYAKEEAQSLNKTQVDTDDLLIGLLREEECIACQVLHNRGVKLEAVRAKVTSIWKAGKKETVSTPLLVKKLAEGTKILAEGTKTLASIIEKEKKESPVRCKIFKFDKFELSYDCKSAGETITKFLSDGKEVIQVAQSLQSLSSLSGQTLLYVTIFYKDKGS